VALTQQEAMKHLDRMYRKLEPQAKEARELKGFYRGDQPLKFASTEWSEEHRAQYDDFSDNWCEVVANSNAERVNVIGIKLPSKTGKMSAKQTPAERKIWDTWRRAEMDSLSQQGFLDAIVARRSFGYVWGNDDGSPLPGWKSAEQAVVEYDPITGIDRRFGLLVWDDEDAGMEWADVYTKAEVWRFKRTKGITSTSGLILPGSTTVVGGWIYVETGANHLELVPLVEFGNRPILGHGPLSDIGGTASMQDAINLLWAYLFSAADFASMPARVIMGQQPPKIPILDANGVKVGERVIDPKELTNGRLLWLTGEKTNINQWDAADLAKFTAVIEQCVGHIAAQTRTPPHYLVANKGLSNLSGDALKAAETGLVSKVRQTVSYFEPRMRDLLVLLALQLGDKQAAEQAKLARIVWKDVESRSDAQTADAMLKDGQAGYPFEYLLEKRGHSPEEIERIMDMVARDTERKLAAGLSDLLNTQQPPPAGQQPEPPAPPTDDAE
jgi:hypothetical protein